MTAPPLYILRHGQTEWNVDGRLQGRLDSDLTEVGRAQARAQNDILRKRDLSGFTAICSPQGRAVQTSQIVLQELNCAVETHIALREIGLGGWCGAARSELIAQTQARDGFDLYDLAPGGEGLDALHRRCVAFLVEQTSPAILITHGMTSRVLRLILTGRPLKDIRQIGGGQGVVFYLENGVQSRLGG